MSNEYMLQELSDVELEEVTGGHAPNIIVNVNTNINLSFTQNNYNIVYAPVNVYGNVTNSNIDNGNAYVQGSHILGGGWSLAH